MKQYQDHYLQNSSNLIKFTCMKTVKNSQKLVSLHFAFEWCRSAPLPLGAKTSTCQNMSKEQAQIGNLRNMLGN